MLVTYACLSPATSIARSIDYVALYKGRQEDEVPRDLPILTGGDSPPTQIGEDHARAASSGALLFPTSVSSLDFMEP
jgi:hypothetical protein